MSKYTERIHHLQKQLTDLTELEKYDERVQHVQKWIASDTNFNFGVMVHNVSTGVTTLHEHLQYGKYRMELIEDDDHDAPLMFSFQVECITDAQLRAFLQVLFPRKAENEKLRIDQ